MKSLTPQQKRQIRLQKELKDFDANKMEYLTGLYKKSYDVMNDLLEKAQKIHNKDEFNKEVDDYVLKVANTVWNQVHKAKELQIKERAAQKEEVSMFHQMLKDANAGNLSEDDLKEIRQHVIKE